MSGDQQRAGIDVSIVIATYNRVPSLERTLRSCLSQTNALGLGLELVVIDNHLAQSARALVESVAAVAPWPVLYVTDTTRNMSVLRNRGFVEARGEHVAIIDDDETAEPDWIDQLVTALKETDADVVVGPRLARFEAGSPPAYDPEGRDFVRDLHLPDKTVLVLTAPSGKPRYGLGTGNSLFHKRRCFGAGLDAMRPEFGDAGGEDAELFIRLFRQGRRIVWAAQAIVTETVAPHRTAVAYRLLRTRREAQHYAAIFTDATRHPLTTRAVLIVKGALQWIAGAMIAGLSGEFGSQRRIGGRLLMAHGAGKLNFGKGVGFIAEANGPEPSPKSQDDIVA